MAGRKILIFTTAKSGSGVSIFNEVVSADLLAAGFDVTVAQPPDDAYFDRTKFTANVPRLNFRRDPYDGPLEFGADKYLAASLLEKVRPDLVVFSNGVHPASSLAGMQSALFFGIPYVVIDGLVAPQLFRLGPPVDMVMSALYKSARSVVVKCRQNLDLLRQCLALPPNVGQVILSGRPPEFFTPRKEQHRRRLRQDSGIPGDGFVCFTSAKLEPVKGHEVQIDAMRLLKDRPVWERLHFIWAGDGQSKADLEADVAGLGVQGRVRFLGHRTDIADLMDAVDCYVLTSHAEAAPLSIIEAMAKGLPVAATNIGGNAEALGGNGILIPRPLERARAAAGLASALERLANDENERQRLGTAAHHYAVAHYQLARMTSDYRAVFEAALENTPNR